MIKWDKANQEGKDKPLKIKDSNKDRPRERPKEKSRERGRDRSRGKGNIASNISTVSQHPFIFTGTVRENLLYSCEALYIAGKTNSLPDRTELINMIREVGLEDDVLRWGGPGEF